MTQSVTIVHERFTAYTGSEKVVAQLAQVWPHAPIVAPIARSENLPPELLGRVTGTALTRLTGPSGSYAHLLPALPVAMRHLKVGRPDIVLASHHAFANQVVHATDSPVIAYVHSPARWVWEPAMRAGEAGGVIGAALLNAFAAMYRPSDRKAAAGLAAIVANSSAVATRICEWWEQPSEVVHPPVDTAYYTPDSSVAREDFFLLAGRLVPYKRPDAVVMAAAAAGVRLVVAGEGRMRAECERVAGPHTTFVGRVTNGELRSLFRRCAAVVMPGIEDFGIVPVEAQACGAPVVATGAGGALDTVPIQAGELVHAGPDGFIERWTTALNDFDPGRYCPTAIRRHAEQFSEERFRTRMQEVVERVTGSAMPQYR
jgi:glycosyltransferase involved in cell wall biosynthesis